MGGGNWSTQSYQDVQALKKKKGTPDFKHTVDVQAGKSQALHDNLSPKGIIRESCDHDDHPESVPIGVVFDVTGSMGTIPRTYLQKLPLVMGLVISKGYIKDPQVCFGAVGDATTDRVPFQIGQFESDVRMANDLERIFIEGGGGGQVHESYGLAVYFFSRRVKADAYTKRGKKGYLFLTGDEMPWDTVTRSQIREIFGDDVEKDISIKELVEEATERWDIYFIIASDGSHGRDPSVEKAWKELLGERALRLDDANAVAELIATTVGLQEEAVDLDDARDHLTASGVDHSTSSSVMRALAPLSQSGALTRAGQASGSLPAVQSSGSGVRRL